MLQIMYLLTTKNLARHPNWNRTSQSESIALNSLKFTLKKSKISSIQNIILLKIYKFIKCFVLKTHPWVVG